MSVIETQMLLRVTYRKSYYSIHDIVIYEYRIYPISSITWSMGSVMILGCNTGRIVIMGGKCHMPGRGMMGYGVYVYKVYIISII